MCQRPVFTVAAASPSSAKVATSITAPVPQRTKLTSDCVTGKRVRFQPPSRLKSFSEPTYSLCDGDKQSMWWTRDELDDLMVFGSSTSTTQTSQKSKLMFHPSVSICLTLFMISNLSILSIAACVLALD